MKRICTGMRARQRPPAKQLDHGVHQPGVFVKQHAKNQAHGHGGAHIGQKRNGFEKALQPQRRAVEQRGDHQRQAQYPRHANCPVHRRVAKRVQELVVLKHHAIVIQAYPAGLFHTVPVGKAVIERSQRGNELENQKLNKKRADCQVSEAITLPQPVFHAHFPPLKARADIGAVIVPP